MSHINQNLNQQWPILQHYKQSLKFNVRLRNQTISLPQAPPPVLYQAYNNTYIIYYRTVNNKIVHLDKNGNVIKELDQKLKIQDISLMSDSIVVVWGYEIILNCYIILQWDLKTNEIIKYPYKDKIDTRRPTMFIKFSQTKFLCCLEQSEAKNDNKISVSITFFQFPFKSSNDKPIYQFQFPQTNINSLQFAQKLNNHSGIAWRKIINSNLNNQLVIHVFDLRNYHHLINEYKFSTPLLKIADLFQIKISDLWQPKKGQIYIKVFQRFNHPKFFQKQRKKPQYIQYISNLSNKRMFLFSQYQQDVIQNYNQVKQLLSQQKTHQFIWDYQQNKIRIPRFACPRNNDEKYVYNVQFINQPRQIKKFQAFRNTSLIFRKLSQLQPFDDRLYFRKCSVHYVDFQSEQLLVCEKAQNGLFQFSNIFINKVSLCQFNTNQWINYQWKNCFNTNLDPNIIFFQIEGKRIKLLIYPIKNIIVHMLMQIIADCDEDLMRQILQISVHQQKEQMNEEKWEDLLI